MAAASRLHRDTGGQMEQYSGDDKNLLPLLAVGGVGVVSVAAHLVGPALQELVGLRTRRHRRPLDLHLRNLELFEGLFATSSPILLKACMNLLGLPAGPLRPPLVDATGDQVEFARGLLAGVGHGPGRLRLDRGPGGGRATPGSPSWAGWGRSGATARWSRSTGPGC